MNKANLKTPLLFAFLFLYGGLLRAQSDCDLNKSIRVQFKDLPLESVFSKLVNQHHLNLSYSSNRLPRDHRVNIEATSISVKSVLEQSLEGTELAFRCLDGQIVVYRQRKKDRTETIKPALTPSPRQIIRGRIIDQETQQPIAFATIIIPGTDPLIGVHSDLKGYFRLPAMKVGRYELKVSHVEYEAALWTGLLLGSGQELVLKLELVQKINTIQEVIITNENAMGIPLNPFNIGNAQRYGVEEAKRYPASYGDPARHAQVFPGLVGRSDISNELVIRGNNPRGILWRVDGIEIPNPNHFGREGTSSGSISTISNNILGNSEFLTGSFPAQYGNTVSGVFDLSLREGNDSLFEHSLEIGTLGLALASEGPFARRRGYKGSYLVNVRSSTLHMAGLFLDTVLVDERLTNYQDIAFKLHFPTKQGGWDVLGLWAISRSGLPKDQQKRTFLANDQALLGVRYKRAFGENTLFKSAMALMGTTISSKLFDVDSLALYDQREYMVTSFLRTQFSLYHRFNRRWSMELGWNNSIMNYLFQGSLISEELPDPFERWVTFDTTGLAGRRQMYSSFKHRKANGSEYVFGLHYLNHKLLGERSLEPRFSAKIFLTDRHWLRIGSGLHSRRESLEYRFHLSPSGEVYNPDLKLTKSFHLDLGYDWRFQPDWLLKTTAFGQFLFRLPYLDTGGQLSFFSPLLQTEGYFSGNFVQNGQGLNYGLEVSIHKQFSNQWYALGSAALYRSLYRTEVDAPRLSPFHGPYQAAILGGKELSVGKNDKPHLLSMNLKMFFNSYQNVLVSLPGQYIKSNTFLSHIDAVDCNDCGYPRYFRMDFQLIYRRNYRRFSGEWRLDIQNLGRRRNVQARYYDFSQNEGSFLYHLRLFPVFSYRLEI